MFGKQSQSSRRLLVLFVATTAVPAASLTWLGWRMVEQDRLLENQRVQERRDQAADLAAAAMQRILAEAEDRLTTFSTAPSLPVAGLGDGATLVMFDNGAVLDRAGTPLPYYPAIPPSAPLASARFAA